MKANWIKPVEDDDTSWPTPGQQVLVVFNPRRRGFHQQIRTAVFYNFNEWYVHGDAVDHGYVDQFHIPYWTDQPEFP